MELEDQPVTAPALEDLPDELIVALRKPVTLGDIRYDQVKLCEPTADQVTQWEKLSGVEADIMAVSIVSGVPKTAVAKIGIRDLNIAARYIGRFLA